jgi:hypothetical protein
MVFDRLVQHAQELWNYCNGVREGWILGAM